MKQSVFDVDSSESVEKIMRVHTQISILNSNKDTTLERFSTF